MIKKIATNGLATILLLNCALAVGLSYHGSQGSLTILVIAGIIGLLSLIFIIVNHALNVSEIDELQQHVVNLKIEINKSKESVPKKVDTYVQPRRPSSNRKPLRAMDPDL